MSEFSRFAPVPVPINRDSELYTGVLELNFQAVEQSIGSIGKQLQAFNSVFLEFTAGEALDLNTLCYLDTSGQMVKADASAEATCSNLLGVSSSAVASGATGKFLIKGILKTTGLTTGKIMYVDTTPGQWTYSKPGSSGEIIRIIGYALDSTHLFFEPDRTWTEIQ